MELILESALVLAAPLALHRSMVQPGTVIAELAELLQPALSHRNIELQTAVSPSRDISADADRLKQVLLNMINNAADELVDGGVIRISARPVENSNTYEISVEDSGPGIRTDTEEPGRNKPFGLGLGLIICREIVEQHGGELVQGTSSELGGAQFTIRLQLPIINDPEQAG
jgi:signal transduction histidine kinase